MHYKIKANILCLIFTIFIRAVVFGQQEADEQTDDAEYTVPDIYLIAKNGKLTKVRSLIADGTDVNATNTNWRTALMSAVFFRNKVIIKELLGKGADVNVKDSLGRTALMIAASRKDSEMVELLIASGADVTVENNNQKTVIMAAEKSNFSKKEKKKLLKLLETAAE